MDLKQQNNGQSWLDCEARGMQHLLGLPVAVVSLYGSPIPKDPSTVRRCQRCPVSIYRRGEVT